jgi:hypothetical protein
MLPAITFPSTSAWSHSRVALGAVRSSKRVSAWPAIGARTANASLGSANRAPSAK